jgi:hypothetical protein
MPHGDVNDDLSNVPMPVFFAALAPATYRL